MSDIFYIIFPVRTRLISFNKLNAGTHGDPQTGFSWLNAFLHAPTHIKYISIDIYISPQQALGLIKSCLMERELER